MNFQGFQSWAEVLAHVDSGAPVYYHAPFDYRPVRVRCTRRPKGRKVRVLAPGSTPGRGRVRTCDPFMADEGHLARFLRKDVAA